MARAGPEPSTLYFLPLSSTERLQPAYCEPRQASTGWVVCTVTTNGHARIGLGGLQRHAAKAAEANLGHAAPGLQTAHRAHAAIDSALTELPLGDLDAQSVGVSDERLDERLRLGVDARALDLARYGDFFPFVHRLPPANALKHRQNLASSLLN